MSKVAVFPGSFDPFTKGHEDIVLRAMDMFDEIIVAIGVNTAKKYYFTIEERIQFIKDTFANHPKISVDTYEGLTSSYCQQKNANFILRGIRNTNDFEFEKNISQLNSQLVPGLETVFLITSSETAAISSSIVREILTHNGDASAFVPEQIKLR